MMGCNNSKDDADGNSNNKNADDSWKYYHAPINHATKVLAVLTAFDMYHVT
eukprot:jgi/Psemu1/8957/gm1.8957_g